jgi:hypothetical protein
MKRAKVMAAAAALFLLGAAFAAQLTSVGADRQTREAKHPPYWTPGTNGVIAAYETSDFPLAPPR